MSLQPWYKVVVPRQDLREGRPLEGFLADQDVLPDIPGRNGCCEGQSESRVVSISRIKKGRLAVVKLKSAVAAYRQTSRNHAGIGMGSWRAVFFISWENDWASA